MCGLTGFLDTTQSASQEELLSTVTRMALTIAHRGPDDSGEWADAEAGIALGFRRLAILDLTAEGHQPMVSVSGRYVIAFNGEVYNYQAIRRDLEKQKVSPAFRGRSDTEVMLAAIEAWGLTKAVQNFIGMFAFALWDRRERVLHLVRDRVGVKPMYYGWAGKQFLFGSELRSLRAHPSFNAEMDRDSLALFMRHNYVPAPYCIFQDIRKLLPGTILSISASNGLEPRITSYWSAKNVAELGLANPFSGSESEAVNELEALLKDCIGLRMISDVPLGVFLSGGIDSSVVTAIMQAQNTSPINTFTIGFAENTHDEAPYAREVARYLGTNHTECILTPEDAIAVIPKLPGIYDEPYADSSQIPTYLVSQLARRHVTVSLSGDGGDELFGGYRRYRRASGIWSRIGRIPTSVRIPIGKMLGVMPQGFWRMASPLARRVMPADYAEMSTPDRLAKLAELMSASSPELFYRRFVSHWKEPESLVLGATEPSTNLTDPAMRTSLDGLIHTMMYLDTVTYLPGDILVKVDRASMAVSLEAREPLLDHRLLEFAWRLPLSMKIKDGRGKWPLRQVLHKYVPEKMVERPKMGFGIPIGAWLRGPLRDWAESLLDPSKLNQQGYLNTSMVRRKWVEHLSGERNWHYYVWDILMFQAWLDEYMPR